MSNLACAHQGNRRSGENFIVLQNEIYVSLTLRLYASPDWVYKLQFQLSYSKYWHFFRFLRYIISYSYQPCSWPEEITEKVREIVHHKLTVFFRETKTSDTFDRPASLGNECQCRSFLVNINIVVSGEGAMRNYIVISLV